MTDMAIQYIRYNPEISSSQTVGIPSPLKACWGGTSITAIPAIDGNQVAVWCSTVWNPLVAQTRTVTFYACPISVLAAACQGTNVLLTAKVIYDDYPPAPAKSAPIQDLCTVYCGQGMTIVSWQWGGFTTGSATGIATSMQFTNEPSDTAAGSSTQAAVAVEDASNNPVAGDIVTIVQQSGPSAGSPPVPGISSPTSTLTAITNTSGVAVFTNINPQLAGSYTITAVDGSATATSTTFQVGPQRSVITPSSPPSSPIQGGPTYHVSATATSGDTVVITDTTSSVCSLSAGVVSFVGPGTCTLNFNDPATGNVNYSPALQVTQSFQVGGLTATQVGIAMGTTTPGASATTNDSVVVTLENSVGSPVKSTGTTTVVISDVANGFFATSNGVAGAASLNLSFANGVSTVTAYFGNQTTGPDTITVINGTSTWGSVFLTTIGGTPTQVAITPSTTTPTVSSLTNTTLSLQLEDQWGNFTTANTSTTLTLSNSGSGFFSSSPGATGSATLDVTFASGVGAASAYFGNQTSGSDLVSAKNGANVWATSTLTLVPGAPAKVQITLSPSSPTANGTTNTTVTLQLQDQYGNAVHTSGVALTLTNAGSGYFASTIGVPKAFASTSLTLSTNASGVVTAYFGDATKESDTITVSGTGISSTSSPFSVA